MAGKVQNTRLHRNVALSVKRLESWADNPWRRSSLLLIFLLVGFFLGSSVGMINGALALMDPVGAFITVLFLEIMVRFRRQWPLSGSPAFTRQLLDNGRIGLLYGLLMEGFKLL